MKFFFSVPLVSLSFLSLCTPTTWISVFTGISFYFLFPSLFQFYIFSFILLSFYALDKTTLFSSVCFIYPDGWQNRKEWPGKLSAKSIHCLKTNGTINPYICHPVYSASFWSRPLHRFSPNLAPTRESMSAWIALSFSPVGGCFSPKQQKWWFRLIPCMDTLILQCRGYVYGWLDLFIRQRACQGVLL